MFWHLYKYRLKVLVSNKPLLFWQGIFPIILGTFFFLAFSGITEKTEKIDEISVAITVMNSTGDEVKEAVKNDIALESFLNEMEKQEVFKPTYVGYGDAIKELEEGKYDGVFVVTEVTSSASPAIIFNKSGMKQTILKNILNRFQDMSIVISEAMAKNPAAAEEMLKELYSDEALVEDINLNSKNEDTYNQYFFALFAMTCMFGANYGLFNTEHCQADQSAVGVRRSASPTKKMAMVLSEYLAGVTITQIMIIVLSVYLMLFLGIDLGNEYGLMLIASVASSFLGVALGYFVGVLYRVKQGAKEGILTAGILFLNFLAGLMVGNMKYMIEESCPIVNRINPAAIISDCFYSICVFDDMNMYIRTLVSIAIWTVVLGVASIIILRRERYAHL